MLTRKCWNRLLIPILLTVLTMSSRVRYEVFHHPVEIPNEPKVFLELRGFFDGEYVVEDLFFY